MNQNPLIPTRSLRSKREIPLRSRRLALGEEDDDAAQQDQLADTSKGPEEDAVPARGVEKARKEVDDGELGQ